MQTTFKGRLFFPPKPLPSSSQSNSTPLVSAQFLTIDAEQEKIEVVSVLGCPLDLKPGDMVMEVEPRPKSGKPGINYWYRGVKQDGTKQHQQ
jgi:hypothetical protein